MNANDPVSEQDLGAPAPSASTESAPAQAVVTDRRRPNRAKYSNPSLIAMLRRPTVLHNGTVGEPLPEESENGIDAAQGIIVSVILSVALWLGLGVLAWLACFLWLPT